MNVYLLSVFYNDLKRAELAQVKPIVSRVSGGNFIRIEADNHACCFAFTSDMPDKDLNEAFRPLVCEHMRFLLVALSQVLSTSISSTSIQWLSRHLRGEAD